MQEPGPQTPNEVPSSYIPASVSLPELTVKAIVLGVGLSALLAGANAYLGLKVGMTVSASIPAAVISMAVLRLFRQSNVLENNLVQTAASAGESLAAGVIFTLPALILLEYWTDFQYLEVTLIAAVGGMLGVLFSIPLRRALIVEGSLRFPEGIATAEVLKAGDEKGQSIRLIVVGGVAGALMKLGQSGFKLLAGSVSGGVSVGRSVIGFGCDLSPALLGVGYIVGLNIAVLVFLGGVLAWLIGIPVYSALHGPPLAPDGQVLTGYEAAITLWSGKIRYMGVGAMFIGGIYALLSLVGPLRRGMRASIRAHRERKRWDEDSSYIRTEHDLSIYLVALGVAVLIVPITLAAIHFWGGQQFDLSSGQIRILILITLGLALVAGFLFSSVAGYMAGLVGSSNNPISGITIATILVTSLILFIILGDSLVTPAHLAHAAAAAILVGALVCCAAAISGDNLQDLKAGHLLGATPVKQQVMQMIGVVTAALVLAPILSLLYHAYGLGDHLPRAGMDQGEALAAPQATLMQSVAHGVFSRNLEWGMMMCGAVIAVLVILLDLFQQRRGSTFRLPVLAVAVGIYLPVELTVPIFLGGLISALAGPTSRGGLLGASGLVAGESLAGVVLAIPFALARSTEVLKLVPDGFARFSGIPGVLLFAVLAGWLYWAAAARKKS